MHVSGPPLYRIILVLVLSIGLMYADMRFMQVNYIRQALSLLTLPIRWSIDIPIQLSSWVGSHLTSRQQLQDQQTALAAELLILRGKLQTLAVIEAENTRLRRLLRASVRIVNQTVAAELIAVDPDPFTHQVIIDRGQAHGVQLGQAVLDDSGLMGQVIQVDSYSSRVLLIADSNHAIPVQVNRNGLRSIAVGTGDLQRLELVYVPDTADIVEGDLLVSSGLGGRFPAGYPVAQVTRITHDPAEPFAQVIAQPKAKLDKSRNVLLVVPQAPPQP